MVNLEKRLVNFLLVEDNDLDAERVDRMLQKISMCNPIFRVKDGESALEYLYENKEDLENESLVILLDINLPKMDGIEFLSIIRADQKLKDLPVFILTSSGNDKDIKNAFNNKIQGYILKPIDRMQLLEVMSSISFCWALTKDGKQGTLDSNFNILSEKINMLIVDDSSIDREKIINLINKNKEYHFNFYEASTIEKGFNIINNNKINIIILDHVLPDGSSKMFLEKMLADGIWLPVIVCTGYGEERVVLDALHYGALDYLNKESLNSEVLHEVVLNSLIIFKNQLKTKEMIEELKNFSGSIAHDLQNPLHTLMGFANLLKNEELSEGAIKLLNKVIKSSERMSSFIDDLLLYSTIDSSKESKAVVNLNILIKEICEVHAFELEELNGTIEVGELPNITGINVRIRQLFQNLIGNSIKYRKSDVPIFIKINSKEIDTNLFEIIIEDNGVGFEQMYAKEIFKPLKRLHNDERFSGSGIGLATCKRIVQQINGDIEAYSEVGVGTKIILTLKLLI
jgi:signal transduction histidine kinase/AmiR/NasT family two-component response regulator